MAKLIFSYGSMNAMKSATLIMQAYTHRTNGKTVIVVKPALDTRDGALVRSRAVPTAIPADIVIKADDVGNVFGSLLIERPRIVLVDEAQFLTVDQVEELASIVDVLDVTVQCYGLMTDFRGEMFAGSKRLVELADVVERIRSECTECGNEGIINARFVNGVLQTQGEQIVTGAEESYKVLCRNCFTGMGLL